MSLPLLAFGFIVLLGLAYRFYGRWVARHVALDDGRPTPATEINDGIDFVPVKPFYLFAQHFSAIAAAGPIAGPILAAQTFGWLPCLLWIGLGVVFIGAVHDFAALAASVRHRACSIAEITREHLGPKAGVAILVFIWIALIYVIVAFTDITSGTFVHRGGSFEGLMVNFNPGGAVAAASVMYLVLSVVMGMVQRFLRPPLWLITLIFVPASLGVAWLGTHISNLLILDARTWGVLILLYCGIASVVPVWSLLQPRGYLGGFILFLALGLGVIGMFFGGYEIQQPAFITWDTGAMTGTLFPFLFVTIACGACSGFHGLVCSGTTSKQIERESHIRPVGFGAMLAEGFVALIALVTIMIFAREQVAGLKPGTIYGNGIGSFLTLLIGRDNLPFAITFGAMAFSTFVFDTLDVCTRLARYIIQELIGVRNLLSGLIATGVTLAIPVFLLWGAGEGSWIKFWTLFGASNQLLAALTLLTITVWLYRSRRRIMFTLLPMLFVLSITLWSLLALVIGNCRAAQGFDLALVNATAALALIILALYLVGAGLIKWLRSERLPESPVVTTSGQ
ncbi:MAG TPA: carbon starvation CstA family protein [candidate division Zixibacteria bacterium]